MKRKPDRIEQRRKDELLATAVLSAIAGCAVGIIIAVVVMGGV